MQSRTLAHLRGNKPEPSLDKTQYLEKILDFFEIFISCFQIFQQKMDVRSENIGNEKENNKGRFYFKNVVVIPLLGKKSPKVQNVGNERKQDASKKERKCEFIYHSGIYRACFRDLQSLSR